MAIKANPIISSTGLVLCLDAANSKSYPGSGTTWTDLSGRGNNGTLTNGPTYSSANGGSLLFDGTNDYVSSSVIPSITTVYNTTIECFVNVTRNSAGPFVHLENTGSNGYGFGIGSVGYSSPGSNFIFETPFTFVRTSLYTFTYDGWHHIVITAGSGNTEWRLYVNGTQSGTQFTQGVSNITSGSAYVTLGRRLEYPSTYSYGACQISNVKVYNRALSAVEIQQNYYATKPRYGI
jgi:hypothetical protein